MAKNAHGCVKQDVDSSLREPVSHKQEARYTPYDENGMSTLVGNKYSAHRVDGRVLNRLAPYSYKMKSVMVCARATPLELRNNNLPVLAESGIPIPAMNFFLIAQDIAREANEEVRQARGHYQRIISAAKNNVELNSFLTLLSPQEVAERLKAEGMLTSYEIIDAIKDKPRLTLVGSLVESYDAAKEIAKHLQEETNKGFRSVYVRDSELEILITDHPELFDKPKGKK
jgi:hypothetical protein